MGGRCALIQGCLARERIAPPKDPTVGLCLGPCGGPRAGTSLRRCAPRRFLPCEPSPLGTTLLTFCQFRFVSFGVYTATRTGSLVWYGEKASRGTSPEPYIVPEPKAALRAAKLVAARTTPTVRRRAIISREGA
jgi:hypothetical protein